MKKCGVNHERAVITDNQVAEVAEPGGAVSAAAARHGFGGLRRSSRASFPRAAFRAGMQNKGAFPKEDPGRRPPPSTSCPCPAWFFRLQRPLFGGSKTPVQERLAPLQLFPFVELG